MSVLLISDDPVRESFRQVMSLKQDIEDLIRKRVDLITFSSDGIFLNRKRMGKELSTGTILSTLQYTFKRKACLLCIISLKLKYLKRVFPDGWNILDLIRKTSPQATVFIFGANSILNKSQNRAENTTYFLISKTWSSQTYYRFQKRNN